MQSVDLCSIILEEEQSWWSCRERVADHDKFRFIERKFSIPGVSARWTFDLPIRRVINDITRMIHKIPSFSDLMAVNVGTESIMAKIHLQYLNDKLILFSSDYIMRTAAQLCEDQTLASFGNHASVLASGIPVLDGIVLGIDFLWHFQRNLLRGRIRLVDYGS